MTTLRIVGRYLVLSFLATCVTDVASAFTLYDNRDIPLAPNNSDVIHPERSDHFLAQPFNMGDYDSISRINVSLARNPNTLGTVDFSLWNDNGQGLPGDHVAELGTIDIESLDELPPREQTVRLPFVTLESEVSGLLRNETYFVLADWRNVALGNASKNNSVHFGAIPSGDAANGADHLIVTKENVGLDWVNSDWVSLAFYGLRDRWLQMSVEGTSSELFGDFDDSGTIDANDVELLTAAIRQSLTATQFDVNRDGLVNSEDRTHWIHDSEFANTYFGDANLDGEFNSGDLGNTKTTSPTIPHGPKAIGTVMETSSQAT